MRKIDILLFDQINLLDVAGPAQAFSNASGNNRRHYETRFVSMDGEPVTSCCGLKLTADGIATVESDAHDLIIPGGDGVDTMMINPELKQLIAAWDSKPNRRLISVCSGALLLANSGVLDDREATTHWSRTAEAQRKFPKVKWQIDKLYVTDGSIYTSAGVSTGIDLSLAIIQCDHNSETALKVARELVVYMQRPGGQSQFSGVIDLQLKSADSLTRLVNEIVQHPARPWTVSNMAEFCNLTERTLARHFVKSLDTTPKRFVEKVRVNKARELLSGGLPLPVVPGRCGLHDQQQLQRAFKRQLGTSVSQYVQRFAAEATHR